MHLEGDLCVHKRSTALSLTLGPEDEGRLGSTVSLALATTIIMVTIFEKHAYVPDLTARV